MSDNGRHSAVHAKKLLVMALTLTVTVAMLTWSASGWSQTGPANPPPSVTVPVAPAPAGERPAVPPPAAVEAPARRENPGLINEIGKLFERRPDLFPALKLPLPAVGGTDVVGSDAGESLPGYVPPSSNSLNPAPPSLPSSSTTPSSAVSPSQSLPDLKVPSFEKGREKCPVAENGAADCKAAADTLCRSKGYRQGKSTDSDATQRCSAEALLLSGRKSGPGACRTEYFVTRAWCQ